MKKTLLTLVLVAFSAAATHAQGTIQFLNSALSKIKYKDTEASAAVDAPAGIVVGVFWGATRESLALNNGDTTTVSSAGLFSGGTVYALKGATAAEDSQPGQQVFLKIAGWLNKGGTTPSKATAGAATPGLTHYGESAIVQTTALGPTAGPGTVVFQGATGVNANRAKPFEVAPIVPEPSVMALGALGLGALLLRRRKA